MGLAAWSGLTFKEFCKYKLWVWLSIYNDQKEVALDSTNNDDFEDVGNILNPQS